jgi:long-subunit acyl-CoA synthetase (AMP-forming)
LVLFDGATEEEKEKGKAANIEVFSFAEFQETGKANPAEPSPAAPDEMVTIMYTSGTTGLPKGVMLSSTNVLADVAGVKFMGDLGYGVNIDKVFFIL